MLDEPGELNRQRMFILAVGVSYNLESKFSMHLVGRCRYANTVSLSEDSVFLDSPRLACLCKQAADGTHRAGRDAGVLSLDSRAIPVMSESANLGEGHGTAWHSLRSGSLSFTPPGFSVVPASGSELAQPVRDRPRRCSSL